MEQLLHSIGLAQMISSSWVMHDERAAMIVSRAGVGKPVGR
jgi:hypothetical protein